MSDAPGQPGDKPKWSNSRKDGVGTAKNLASHVWFTIADGIVTEIFYPRVDRPAVREMRFFVGDGKSFLSDEREEADHEVRWLADGVPAFEVVNRCRLGRYTLRKTVLSDPDSHVLLQRVRLEASDPDAALRLYTQVQPHLMDKGTGNRAYVGDHKGVPMVFADRAGQAMAVACDAAWLQRSAGYVGVSDGREDFRRHKRMTWTYPEARCGNVALTGEIDLNARKLFAKTPDDADSKETDILLVIAFGRDAGEAGHRALHTLQKGFDEACEDYCREWEDWHADRAPAPGEATEPTGQTSWRISNTVLAVHESKDLRGGLIAGLASPWGKWRGDGDSDGYHVVWSRDCCETVGAMMAAGATKDCQRVLEFLRATQEADGHWPQSMWLSGKPAQDGLQLDEAALPILAVDLVVRDSDARAKPIIANFWPMIQRAARFIADHGPATKEDRWEHNPGYTPFTIAAEISALLVAADYADTLGEPALGRTWRETADAWEASIDSWLYASDTDLAKRCGVDGYYVRVAPQDARQVPLVDQRPSLANTHPEETISAIDLISPDALALVRFGLRAASDPRILNTVIVIDALLKTETARGPVWHRYNGDSYGEHEDGRHFDKTGVGRGWPLLTGERAHYELAAGRKSAAESLLRTMERFASDSGLISEQVWDTADLPLAGLWNARPTLSACPLVWAHAEHLKLIRSIAEGRIFDLPERSFARFVGRR